MPLTRTVPIVLILFFFFFLPTIRASELELIVSTSFDAETIAKGYTLESHDGLFRLGIRPNTLQTTTSVDVKTLDPSVMADTLESFVQDSQDAITSRVLLGQMYLFDILDKESYDASDYFFLEIKYPNSEVGSQKSDVGLHGKRRIYFYNGMKSAWEELPSTDNPDTQSVRALIHLPYARVAIFEEEIPELGDASWYSYQGCDCAASPDYPQGSYLVVTSVGEPTKSVTVLVNDYGPDRSVHPDRIIDLDRVAFEKLASLGLGLIEVRVKLLQ